MTPIYQYVLSGDILLSDDTLRSVTAATYTKYATLTMPANMIGNQTIRINVWYQTHYYDRYINLKIYINGVATNVTTGNVYSTGGALWETDLSGVYAEDTIELWGHNDSGNDDWWGKESNYRIFGKLNIIPRAYFPARGRGYFILPF